MPDFVIVLLAVLAAYLLGSVPFAVVCSRLFGLADPRSYGSKNPGATNVLRSGNKAAAALTLLGDMAKGWLAVFLAQTFGPKYGFSHGLVGAVALAVFSATCIPSSSTSRVARGWQRPPVFFWPLIRCWA